MSPLQRSRRIFLALLLTAGLCGSFWAASPVSEGDTERVDLVLVTHQERSALEQSDLPVIWKGASFFLAEWDDATQDLARRLAVPFEVVADAAGGIRGFYMVEARDDNPPPEWEQYVVGASETTD